MTILQRAVLAIVREVVQDKKGRKVFPDDAIMTEISASIRSTLSQLVAMGELSHRLLSVNKYDAYTIPENTPDPCPDITLKTTKI